MSGLRAMVVALDERGCRVTVGPVMPVNAARLREEVTAHGWTVTGTATQLSVAGFRALARDRARRGGGPDA